MYYDELLVRDIIDKIIPHPHAKSVLIILARHTDHYGVCYPSLARLVELTAFSKSTVTRALKWCEDYGYIVREKGRTGRATTYYFTNLIVSETTEDELNVTQTHQGVSQLASDDNPSSNIASIDFYPWGVPQTQTLEYFATFWAAYPRKVAKGHARLAFLRACVLTHPSILIDAAERFAETAKHIEIQFIPHPTNWLEAERWEDDLEHLI